MANSIRKQLNEIFCEQYFTYDGDYKCLFTWEQYAISTLSPNGLMQRIINNLQLSDFGDIDHLRPTDCPHHLFDSRQQFICCLVQYTKSLIPAISSCTFKDGICSECAHQFILATNHLSDIFDRFLQLLNDGYKNKLFRTEFNKANIMLHLNPLFVKCLLFKSNRRCIVNIFRTFFEYMKLDFEDEIENNNLRFPISNGPDDFYCIVDKNNPILTMEQGINTIDGIEYSLSALSNQISGILDHIKVSSFLYLFHKIKDFDNVVVIIESFLKKYCNLPHIRHQDKILRQREKEYYKKYAHTIEEVSSFYQRTRPLLFRLILIFGMMFERIIHCMNVIKSKSSRTRKFGKIFKKLKRQKHVFGRRIKLRKMNGMNCALRGGYDDAYTALVLSHLVSSVGKVHLQISSIPIFCTFCDKKQSNDENEFKKCGGCQLSYYCSVKCQKLDWKKKHRLICTKLSLT